MVRMLDTHILNYPQEVSDLEASEKNAHKIAFQLIFCHC